MEGDELVKTISELIKDMNVQDAWSLGIAAQRDALQDFIQLLEKLGNDPMARIDARKWAKHYRRKLKALK